MHYSMPKYAEEIKFKAIMMTPERAEQLLVNNHPLNRAMKRGKIAQMRSDMENGDWKLTPEPIVVSDKGNLINGQNRCQACTEAQATIPVYFCTGVPESVIVAMDCGTSRNVADAAKILNKDIKGVNGVAAVARRMSAGMTEGQKTQPMSIQETLAWIDNHKTALLFAWECLPTSKHGITQAGVRAVLARAYYKRPVEETRARCMEFGSILMSGLPENPKKDSAAIRLRNWLQDHFSRGTRTKKQGARVAAVVVYAKTETALNHFLNYEPVESLKETSNELFWLPGEKSDEKEIQLAQETA